MALRFGNPAFSSGKAMLTRARLSVLTAAACRSPASRFNRAFASEPTPGSQANAGDAKAKINAAWNTSAQGYVGNIQRGGGVDDGPSSASSPVEMDMSVGYKLAARIVASLSNKRCEGTITGSNGMCKSRATHGDPEEGASVCELHETDGMVQLKEAGSLDVLDVASAGGEPAITIAKLLPHATVHATDFAPAMMDLIRQRAAEAGVSNVTASVADGEALTEFEDGSVDAVTCTFGMIFMPNWQQAVKEFARVLRGDGVVAVTLWERYDDSVFERIDRVLNTLDPGFEGLIDPISLGEDKGSAVAEEMNAVGLRNVTVSQFTVPLVLSPEGRIGDIWEYYTSSSPLGQTVTTLEAKGRTNVRQEARDIFERHMESDWAKGRTPLGLPKDTGGEPRIIYSRALLVVGRKCGGE
ncbi:unnamed protein product [Scytosiphon promiscuus]